MRVDEDRKGNECEGVKLVAQDNESSCEVM